MDTNDTFADGLMALTIRGYLVRPVRLSPKLKQSLLNQIVSDLERTATLEESQASDFIAAMMWLKNRANRTRVHVRFSKEIATTLYFWLGDNRYTIDDDARQWVRNIINKRYAPSELSGIH